jgi:hypothetical protein
VIFCFLFCMLWASSSIGRRKHVLQVSLLIQMGAVESFDAKTCYDHNSTMLIFHFVRILRNSTNWQEPPW